ncbi:MAG: hypothetical protein ACI9MC_000037 [Kiritimatiellia bacterium]|jgi:hypothetical protein
MRWLAMLVVPLLMLVACDTQTYECSEDVPCQGFGEVCIAGTCEVPDCSTNLDCPMEMACNGGSCAPGCDGDKDCYPGSVCNLEEGMCESAGCTDTHLDCGYREFCNTLTGECYDAGRQYCKPCDRDNVAEDCNNGDANGTNVCWNNYCLVDCSNGRECPSGFQCYPFSDQSGNITTWQCLTYCWLYEDLAPGGQAAAPPPPLYPIDPTCPPKGFAGLETQ